MELGVCQRLVVMEWQLGVGSSDSSSPMTTIVIVNPHDAKNWNFSRGVSSSLVLFDQMSYYMPSWTNIVNKLNISGITNFLDRHLWQGQICEAKILITYCQFPQLYFIV